MAIRVLQLGTPRTPGERLRLGTVRRPPRAYWRNGAAADPQRYAYMLVDSLSGTRGQWEYILNSGIRF
jgi:hypothetical protein